jgi:hypothetical protein
MSIKPRLIEQYGDCLIIPCAIWGWGAHAEADHHTVARACKDHPGRWARVHTIFESLAEARRFIDDGCPEEGHPDAGYSEQTDDEARELIDEILSRIDHLEPAQALHVVANLLIALLASPDDRNRMREMFDDMVNEHLAGFDEHFGVGEQRH